MNKYIKADLQDSIKLMRIAIMNALNDIDSGEETKINLGPYISRPLLSECLQEAKWKIEIEDPNIIYYTTKTPSGKRVSINLENGDCILFSTKYISVSISISLSSDQEIEVTDNPNEINEEYLKDAVQKQICLPISYDKKWNIDEFSVVQN